MNFVDISHTCNSLLYNFDISKTKLQSILPFVPDCEVREYILKQSEFVTNHYIDARNECLKIFNEGNSTCEVIEDTGVNLICLNVKKEYKSCLILPSSDFSKSSTELIVPRKSKFVKNSKLKKKLYFITKEISLLSISFITSINMKSAFFKSEDMNVYGLLNCSIVSCEEGVECNEKNVTKLMEDKPKVVVERATTSTISFGSISALLDEHENQKDVYFNNFSDESPLKKSPNKRIKCDSIHNDYANNLLVSGISNHKHRFCDDNYNFMNVKKKYKNILLHSVNEGVHHDIENKSDFKSNRRRRGRPSMFKQNYGLFKLSKYSKRLSKYLCQNSRYENKRQPKNVFDLELVKNELLKGEGPEAAVVLHRLNNEYIHKAINKADQSLCDKEIAISNEAKANPENAAYTKPSYIVSGSGTKIKDIPKIVSKIWSAGERAINLIHHILFLQVEEDHKSRLNILEFSGYPECQKDFLDHRIDILNKLHSWDIRTICRSFTINITLRNKAELIESLFRFLKSPSANFGCKRKKQKKQFTSMQVPCARTKIKKTKPTEELHVERLTITNSPVCDASEPWVETYAEKPLFEKFRNIDKICFNVECAAPEDLNELNDLLFIKPCESSEIHQQILEFSGFAFKENSIEYQYRKTLMHYMDFSIIKKVALLLDIPGCEDHSNKQELSSIILRFLMEPKQKSGGTSNKNRNGSLHVFNSSNAIMKKDHQLQVQEKILPPDINKVTSDLSTTQFPVQLQTSNVSTKSDKFCHPDVALPHISNEISPHDSEDSSDVKPYPVHLQNYNVFMGSNKHDFSDLALPNINNITFPHHFEDSSDTNQYPDHDYSRGCEKKTNEVQDTDMEVGQDTDMEVVQDTDMEHISKSVNPSIAALCLLNCTPRRTHAPLIARVQAI